MDTLYTLIENGVLELGNVFESCIRWLGWGLITLLAKLVNGIENTTNKVYTLNGFFNSSEVNQLIDKYKPLIWVILAISIGILGFRIIFNRQQNRNELPSNILFSILVVVLLSTFMTKMNDITKVAISSINNSNQSLTDTLVKESLYDIYYLDDNDFSLDGEKNNIGSDGIYNIDINEAIDTDEVEDSDLFKKKIVFNVNGDKKLIKLEKGWFSIDEMYYRYNIDFVPVIISLGAIGIAFVCVMLKVIRLLFELAFNKFFITLLAFADISDGKKLKEMVKHIISIFIVIFITAILTNMYMLYNSWITKSLVDNGLGDNGILKILFIVGGAIAVIDAPNLVERILGIDAGLKSSWGAVMAGYGVAKGALNTGKLLTSGMSKLGNGLALGMAGTGGAISGMFGDKEKDNIPNKESDLGTKNQEKDSMQEQIKASKNNEADLNTINDKFKDIDEFKNNSSNDSDNSNKDLDKAETLQDQMKASKNNAVNLSALNDKFKDIENLRSNPNKDFNRNAIENDKLKDVAGEKVQEGIGAVKNDANNLNASNDKFKDIENLRSNPNKDFNRNAIESDKSKGVAGEKVQEGIGAVKNDANNLNASNDKFKDIENLRNNPNKAFNRSAIESDKSKDLAGEKVQGGIGAVKNDENNLNASNDKFKDIENLRSNPNKDFNRNAIESDRSKDLAGEKVQGGIGAVKNDANNLNASNDKSNGIVGDSRNTINKNNTESIIGGSTSNTEDKTNVVTSNRENNDTKSENTNSERKEVKGKMEDRTIGQYMSDKVQGSRFVDNISRAYSLGYNTTSKWDIKKNKEKGRKK